MPRKRFIPHRLAVGAETPFADAETAWFWFMHCQKARWDGAEFERGLAEIIRPCEPDDIYRCVRRLVTTGIIGDAHFRVLVRFGALDRPPDPNDPDEAFSCRLWDEALDRLLTILRHEGIVE